MRFAFDLARTRTVKKVSSVTKSNAQQYGMVLWDETFNRVALDYPDVTTESVLVDAMSAKFVLTPEDLSVVVASNLNADILSDLGSALAGSLGLAASANLNPERRFPSMFEPVHGSAPDIAGQGIANPIGTIASAALMLDHFGLHAEARLRRSGHRADHRRRVPHPRHRRDRHHRRGHRRDHRRAGPHPGSRLASTRDRPAQPAADKSPEWTAVHQTAAVRSAMPPFIKHHSSDIPQRGRNHGHITTAGRPPSPAGPGHERVSQERGPKTRWYRQLYFWVLIAIVCGVLVGWLAPAVGIAMEPIGTTFVTAMKMLIGPIVFLTIVGGIASVADLKKVGMTGLKALTYFQVGTILAMVFGLVAINVFRLGDGVNADADSIETSDSAAKLIDAGARPGSGGSSSPTSSPTASWAPSSRATSCRSSSSP